MHQTTLIGDLVDMENKIKAIKADTKCFYRDKHMNWRRELPLVIWSSGKKEAWENWFLRFFF